MGLDAAVISNACGFAWRRAESPLTDRTRHFSVQRQRSRPLPGKNSWRVEFPPLANSHRDARLTRNRVTLDETRRTTRKRGAKWGPNVYGKPKLKTPPNDHTRLVNLDGSSSTRGAKNERRCFAFRCPNRTKDRCSAAVSAKRRCSRSRPKTPRADALQTPINFHVALSSASRSLRMGVVGNHTNATCETISVSYKCPTLDLNIRTEGSS